jgi:hypothetical protein
VALRFRRFAMRVFAFAAAIALSMTFAATAAAGPVVVRPFTVDTTLQKKFEDDYGTREIATLQQVFTSALTRELSQAGGAVSDSGPVIIETTLVDVKPSKPTLEQVRHKPGLDQFRSISLGGAELRARILAADGRVLQEVNYDWYETDLLTMPALTTWSDADRAIRRFADKVAEAYRPHGQ